jgi:hypothetical protein
MDPNTNEISKAMILGVRGIDFLPRAALDLLCHHVELVGGGYVPLLPIGLLLGHHGWLTMADWKERGLVDCDGEGAVHVCSLRKWQVVWKDELHTKF